MKDVYVINSTSTEAAIQDIANALAAIASAKGIVSDIRVTLVGATGATLSTITTVGTVTTVTGITNFGGLSAYPQAVAAMNFNAVLSNINNVSVN